MLDGGWVALRAQLCQHSCFTKWPNLEVEGESVTLQDGQADVDVGAGQEVISLEVDEVPDTHEPGPRLLGVLLDGGRHLVVLGEVQAAHHPPQEGLLLGLQGQVGSSQSWQLPHLLEDPVDFLGAVVVALHEDGVPDAHGGHLRGSLLDGVGPV